MVAMKMSGYRSLAVGCRLSARKLLTPPLDSRPPEFPDNSTPWNPVPMPKVEVHMTETKDKPDKATSGTVRFAATPDWSHIHVISPYEPATDLDISIFRKVQSPSSISPADVRKSHVAPVSWHERLRLLAGAALGIFEILQTGQLHAAEPQTYVPVMFAPVYTGTTQAHAAPPGTSAVTDRTGESAPSLEAGRTEKLPYASSLPQFSFAANPDVSVIPQQDIHKVLLTLNRFSWQQPVSPESPAGADTTAITLTPAQGALAVQVHQGIDRGCDQVIEILVQVQPEPPSAQQAKDARDFLHRLHRELVGHLLDPDKLADHIVHGAETGGWLLLLHMIKRLKESPQTRSNPILSFLLDGWEKLRDIFDLSKVAEPKKRPIGFLADHIGKSQKQTEAILKAGPFTETEPGAWQLAESKS
jgi:hypothetical protein